MSETVDNKKVIKPNDKELSKTIRKSGTSQSLAAGVDPKVAESQSRLADEADMIFDQLQSDFSFDDLGSDIQEHESYYDSPVKRAYYGGIESERISNSPSKKHKRHKKHKKHRKHKKGHHKGHHKKHGHKKGTPRYPPIDKDKLYEVGLLIYLRDFHLGMII